MYFSVRPRIVELTVSSNGTAGGTIVFTCNATGFPSPSIVWRRNGDSTLLPNSNKYSVSLSTVTMPEMERIFVRRSTLQISNLFLGDKANYSCFAENNLARLQEQESSRELFEVLCKINLYNCYPNGLLLLNPPSQIHLMCPCLPKPSQSIKLVLPASCAKHLAFLFLPFSGSSMVQHNQS